MIGMLKKCSAVIFLVMVLLCACSPSGNSDNSDKATYERIGYAKFELDSGTKNRSFVFYTDETDTEKILEHAKDQMNTAGGFTYVHYYNDRTKAPDNTLFSAEIAYDLKDYTDGQILVYEKMASGKEVVWDGEMKNYEELSK